MCVHRQKKLAQEVAVVVVGANQINEALWVLVDFLFAANERDL